MEEELPDQLRSVLVRRYALLQVLTLTESTTRRRLANDDGRRHASYELYARRHLFQGDAHGNALSKTYPLEIWIDRGQQSATGGRRVGNGATQSLHLAAQHGSAGHQPHVGFAADFDCGELGLHKVSVDVEGVIIDQRKHACPPGRIVADGGRKVGDEAVYRRAYRAAFQIELGGGELGNKAAGLLE
jgi:hypothetical protein